MEEREERIVLNRDDKALRSDNDPASLRTRKPAMRGGGGGGGWRRSVVEEGEERIVFNRDDKAPHSDNNPASF